MNAFIEQNKKWLKFYANAASVIGWVLIILSAMPALLIPYMISGAFHEYPDGTIRMLSASTEILFERLPLGIIVLGVAQFIRSISESQYQPGWLLRHASGILYFFAILMIVGRIVRYGFYIYGTKSIDILHIEMHFLAVVAMMLILIGLGNILKRVLPIIEEHKSLV